MAGRTSAGPALTDGERAHQHLSWLENQCLDSHDAVYQSAATTKGLEMKDFLEPTPRYPAFPQPIRG
jgi:hypothetical protein